MLNIVDALLLITDVNYSHYNFIEFLKYLTKKLKYLTIKKVSLDLEIN